MVPSRAPLRATRVAELALWGVGVLGAATAAVAGTVRSAPVAAPAVADVLRPLAEAYRDRGDDVLAAATVLADSDPFRVTHRPASVAFDAPVPAAGPPGGFVPAPPITVPRSRLALLGIVGGGGRWAAVLAGVAGHDGGALVRAGDTLGALRVRRVTADSLVVQEALVGRDTVWRLTLGNALPGAAGGGGLRP
ncbi:MAG TPA: hypothetical protein VGD56_17090 [Gemmatirosa sp.]